MDGLLGGSLFSSVVDVFGGLVDGLDFGVRFPWKVSHRIFEELVFRCSPGKNKPHRNAELFAKNSGSRSLCH